MARFQLLVMDVDGTLVGADGHVAAGAAAAIAAAQAAGVTVALSTGRTPPACAAFLDELSLAGNHIYFDGSLVVDLAADRPLLECRADALALRDVLAFAKHAGVTVELYTRNGYFVSRITPEVEEHATLQRCAPVATNLEAVLATGMVIKAELVLTGANAIPAVRAFEQEVAGRLRLSWATAPGLPHLTFINVVNSAVSKGEAVHALAEHLAVPLDTVVAVGDSRNDVPMFQRVGLAIAMGNAPPEVRQVAHVVTGLVGAGGLADAIFQHVLPGVQAGSRCLE